MISSRPKKLSDLKTQARISWTCDASRTATEIHKSMETRSGARSFSRECVKSLLAAFQVLNGPGWMEIEREREERR